ncbi:dentin sialophosphoprotein [Anopheles gambiae]|uniref:dentin sialophosphoprotein n=1 Tax=Anopheles gambiae TaxID=7165 RepID=UPI002AC92CAD|nr:dentin sialophosphoprotein [Anopheles gambiae]
MDKCKLIKEINKLQTLLKTRRVVIIHKLVRLSKLFTAKAATSSDPRAQKKAENYVAILTNIKSLSPATLLEKVIQYQPAKNWQPADPPSIEQRSIARFMEDEKLVRHLKSLEGQFGKGEKSKLLEVLKKKSKIKTSVNKQKKKERIAKRLAKEEKKKQNTGKQNDASDNKKKLKRKLDNDGTDVVQQTRIASYESDDGSEPRSIKLNESDQSDEEEQFDQRSSPSVSVSESDPDYASDEDSDANALESRKNYVSVAKPKKAIDQESKPIISEPELPYNQSLPAKKKVVNYKAPEDDDEEDGVELLTDSFFITETGERYVAVAPKLKPRAEGDEESEEEEEESWKFANKRKKREQQWQEQDNDEELDFGQNYTTHSKASNLGGKGKFANGKQMYNQSSKINEDLHPSWAAKQAQQGIKPFAGKKVVFDAEDGDTNMKPVGTNRYPNKSDSQSDLHPSWAAKQAQQGIKPFAGKKIVFDAEDGDTNMKPVATNRFPSKSDRQSDLHPSWAAKQAQQGIKPFAGKKIVFDGEDGDTNMKPVATNRFPSKSEKQSDLHPSWAAKQAQQGIKPFAGKKVVFDAEDGDTNMKPVATNRYPSKSDRQSDLHPSWAAKQAQQGIKPFAGKKVVFDADDNDNERAEFTSNQPKSDNFNSKSDLHPSWAAKQARNGTKIFDGNGTRSFPPKHTSNNDLHPSWAAKQAQSGIKPFAGKKIAFNDDDNDGSNHGDPTVIKRMHPTDNRKNNDLHLAKQARNAVLPFNSGRSAYGKGVHKSQADNSDLHPSWAAKQAQSGIKPFAGKKITFDAE